MDISSVMDQRLNCHKILKCSVFVTIPKLLLDSKCDNLVMNVIFMVIKGALGTGWIAIIVVHL